MEGCPRSQGEMMGCPAALGTVWDVGAALLPGFQDCGQKILTQV